MGNAAQGENAAHGQSAANDGDAPDGSAAQPPQIPGLHPQTQELLAARYGRPSAHYGPPVQRYGRPPAMRYSVKAFVIGWLVAYGTLLVLALGVGFAWSAMTWGTPSPDAPSGTAILGSSVMVLMYIPLFAAFPALFVGVPAALGVVFALRNVRNQWWHVVGFALAGFLTPMPAVLLMGLGGAGDGLAPLLLFGAAGALCAVVGRLAIWKLVEVTLPLTEAS